MGQKQFVNSILILPKKGTNLRGLESCIAIGNLDLRGFWIIFGKDGIRGIYC